MKNKYIQVSLTYTRGEQFPIGNGSRQLVNLGETFLEECMVRPPKPDKSGTSMDYNIWANWNKLTVKSKVNNGIRRYVKDIGGSNPEFELM